MSKEDVGVVYMQGVDEREDDTLDKTLEAMRKGVAKRKELELEKKPPDVPRRK